tara:strand:- start:7862 stop:8242 length:381 start_codon:yes stop_codon:yes gene_type:complete
MPDVYFVSRVAPFVAPKKEVKMSIQKINTKQLTQIKSVIKKRKEEFYFWYYCPDLKKDRLRKFANTEADAKVLRGQIKETQMLSPSSSYYRLRFRKLKNIYLETLQNGCIVNAIVNEVSGINHVFL